MDTEKNIRWDAANKLLGITGLNLTFHSNSMLGQLLARIGDEWFVIVEKSEITQGNFGLVLQQLKETAQKAKRSILLLTRYIPASIAKYYVAEGMNYLDTAGNCFIRQGALCVVVEGKKAERKAKVNQPRAFQEAGIKLLYQLLLDPEKINKPVRELAALAQISVGSVSTIIRELTDLQFILQTKKKKILKNKPELLARWVVAYHDVLRPRLVIKRMNFTNPKDANWADLPLQDIPEKTIWGGEWAACWFTGSLTAESYTIYTDATWQTLGKTLKLIPEDTGKIEILRLFYKAAKDDTYVSPLLTYADLMGSGDSRNIETAKLICDRDLQHLK
ncbi:MAG: hypothetical protein LBN93_00555 [Candidatus Symbiothrix sp.]|jgi:hypothetical protein|nr:hypothetical protein [Candidatus Symbiothrix sp.]